MRSLCTGCFLILAINVVLAKIWRVNNNALTDPDVASMAVLFDGINTANNPEVQNGDTIHLEPSATAYSTLSNQ